MAKDPGHPHRLSAALAAWRLNGDTTELIPAFTAALETYARLGQDDHSPLSREVRECLAELDTQLKPAMKVMALWLKQRQWSAAADQAAVVDALGRLGADARSEVDLLRSLLDGHRWYSRRSVAAAQALFRIHGDRDLVFPPLRDVLLGREEHPSLYYFPDPADTARVHAARALGELAEKGDVPAQLLIVETAKGDENLHVRTAALEAMARRKETNTAANNGLCALLRDPDAAVRVAAASACRRLGPLAKSNATALRAATQDGYLSVRQAARQALEAVD
jgi:hypothetical protein